MPKIKKIAVRAKKKIAAKKLDISEYARTLADLKKHVQEAQIKAVFSVNKELIKLYWVIGKTIAEKKKTSDWGTKVIENLAKDLQNLFPGIEGFSLRNIFRMSAFYRAYEIVPQPVAQLETLPIFSIPWGHNAVILEKIKDNEKRFWYAQKVIAHGWSRSMLETWIENDLYSREGKAITNFKKTLPSPHSHMAQQSLKDPYVFDFLTLHGDFVEQELEQGLIDHIQKFLLELGDGFAFVARQFHLVVDDLDYYIDLLFYHIKLRCYVVVELKSVAFKPEFAGKLNFYLSAVDDLLRNPGDNPTIGLLLCKTKRDFTAEYALRDIHKPIGIARYETMLVEKLPKELKGSLPTVAEIEEELEKQQILIKQKSKRTRKK